MRFAEWFFTDRSPSDHSRAKVTRFDVFMAILGVIIAAMIVHTVYKIASGQADRDSACWEHGC
jgi:hypothetical protein